jgi:hypothetical protein
MQNVVRSWIEACETHITYSSDMSRPDQDSLHLRRVRLVEDPFVGMLYGVHWRFEVAIDLGTKGR